MPFEATLRLDATFDITEEPYFTYSGPGVMDILKIEDEYNYTITSTTPGLYFITSEVENDGITYFFLTGAVFLLKRLHNVDYQMTKSLVAGTSDSRYNAAG